MPEIQSIHVDSLAFGGNAVGRIAGKVCFVTYGCPGDDLKVRVTSSKRSFMNADIAEILSPSTQRVVPVCSLFGVCGGCLWQHVSYKCQAESKQAILAQALWRSARVPPENISDIIPAPEQYGYRSRVQCKLAYKNSTLVLGFYRQNSHIVADISHGCPIAKPLVNQALKVLRFFLPKCPDIAAIREIHIDSAENGVQVLVEYSGNKIDEVCSFFLENKENIAPVTAVSLSLLGRRESLIPIFGEPFLCYRVTVSSLECQLAFLPGSFSQVNRLQNQALISIVERMASPYSEKKILDLYCGNGNFSLPLAMTGAIITGVELSKSSIEAASYNCELNHVTSAVYVCADVADYVKNAVDDSEQFDIVVIDPPRAGAAHIMSLLPALKPDKIIYVSCDPSTLARDCGTLVASGYTLCESVPVDMFPQTWHLESVTLFVKKYLEPN